MGLNIKKKNIVGVSVTPGIGIEVAVIDYSRRMLVNYISKPFKFGNKLQGDFDLDIFKETLYDALVDLGVPQGASIVLNLPSTVFGVKDWPASIDKAQLAGNIEDDILEVPVFKDNFDEPAYSYCILPNSTIQFNKVAYAALPKSLLIEIALQIKDLKYKLVAIDVSANSTLNALIYTGRVDISPNINWVMLTVESGCFRIFAMQGKNYIDCVEEDISIGKVLGDEENYNTIISAVTPILKSIPSSLLYIISKTDIISAETLASKLEYKAQIVHQEANSFNQAPLIDMAVEIDPEIGRLVSFDVIGAAIKKDFGSKASAQLNLFNEQLGDIYLSQTPPRFMGIELSVDNMLRYGVILGIVILALTLSAAYYFSTEAQTREAKIQELNNDIAKIDAFLKEHEDISSQKFSEADEIRMGITDNKNVYSYYTIVGTEIPKKLWLTSLKLGDEITIEGQADNLESVYGFFRNIKDYNPTSPVKLQKLGLAGNRNAAGFSEISGEDFDSESILTTLNADFYEFRISNKAGTSSDAGSDKKNNDSRNALPDLEPLE